MHPHRGPHLPEMELGVGKHGAKPFHEGASFVVVAAAANEHAPGVAVLGGDGEQAIQRLRTGANAVEGGDFAVFDLDQGLDAEQRAEHGGRAADAATAAEVLERIEAGDHASAVHGAACGIRNLGEGATRRGGDGGIHDDAAQAHRDLVGVDELDVGLVGELVSRDGSRVERAGEARREVDGHDLGAFSRQRSVGRVEAIDGRLAGAGNAGEDAKAFVEGIRIDLDAIEERFVAEDDGERDDDDAQLGDESGREVAGGIGDDAYSHNCSDAYAEEYKLFRGKPLEWVSMTSVKLAPSILTADFGRLADEVRTAEAAGVDLLHLDVMDGRFVPNITFGHQLVEALRKVTALPFDLHLMVIEPERQVPLFEGLADTINVHVEVSPHINRTLDAIRKLGARCGVCINPGTPVAAIEESLPEADQVMVMTINPGWGGQQMLPRQLDKVARIRALIDAGGFGAEIMIDGGVKASNAAACAASGANTLVCGSSVYNAEKSVAESVAALRAALRGT